MLRCSKLHELILSPGKLAWPWVAFAPERTAFAVPAMAGARQPRSLRTEVLVVGAGISGAMIAQSLHRRSARHFLPRLRTRKECASNRP